MVVFCYKNTFCCTQFNNNVRFQMEIILQTDGAYFSFAFISEFPVSGKQTFFTLQRTNVTYPVYSWGLGLDLCSPRVGRVVVVGARPRRRVVVGASLISLYWAVHTHCDTVLTFKM